jgi:hypothetical protein
VKGRCPFSLNNERFRLKVAQGTFGREGETEGTREIKGVNQYGNCRLG